MSTKALELITKRPPDRVSYGDWEPHGESYLRRVDLAEGLYPLWHVPVWRVVRQQPFARKRFEEWLEGDQLVGRWTWEPEPQSWES